MSVSQNNVYVHSNPPKAISGSGAAIRQWVRTGDIEKLEKLVLEGQGARLLGLVESSQDPKVKTFLRSIPGYMAKVDLIHDAVIRGSLRETQTLIDKKKLATARDAVGRGLGHKAVIYNNKSILEWLAKKHPEIFNLKDNEGRTCLHYSAASRDPEDMYDLLVNLGSNPEVIDMHGRKASYYVAHPEELDIEGPTTRSVSRGKRRRISPISPPKRKMIVSPPSITRAQIRIWIHEKDILKLERIVWSGHGDKLLLETTNNGKVRKFLENVPHLLSRIKSIHGAAINNDLEGLKDMRTKTELKEIFKAKDLHGLTPLHKAAGLGNRGIMEFFLYEIPDSLNEIDNEGRTPLHYAARDPNVYNFILKDGGDESVMDQKGKTPAYYRLHPMEIDTRHLRNVPDAPRVSGDLSGWDRASPTLVVGGKRRTSSGEFSNEVTPGKYELTNVELSAGELQVEDLEFVPPPKVLSRNQSQEEVVVVNNDAGSRTISRAGSKNEIKSRTSSRNGGSRTVSRKNSRNDFSSAGTGQVIVQEELMTLEDQFFDEATNEVFDEPAVQTETEEPMEAEGEMLEDQAPPPEMEFEAQEDIAADEVETVETEVETFLLSRSDEGEAIITMEEPPEFRPDTTQSIMEAINGQESEILQEVEQETEPVVEVAADTVVLDAEEFEAPDNVVEADDITEAAVVAEAESIVEALLETELTAEAENVAEAESTVQDEAQAEEIGQAQNGEEAEAIAEEEAIAEAENVEAAEGIAQEEEAIAEAEIVEEVEAIAQAEAIADFENIQEAEAIGDADNIEEADAIALEEAIADAENAEEAEVIGDAENVIEDETATDAEVIDEAETISDAETIAEAENAEQELIEAEIVALADELNSAEVKAIIKNDAAPIEMEMDEGVIVGAIEESADVEAEGSWPSMSENETVVVEFEPEVIEKAELLDVNESKIDDNEPENVVLDEEVDDVEAALTRGDMEALVTKILDGRGAQLLNRKSDNPNVQEFLKSVPGYMEKIKNIHSAATNGKLLDLQNLMDRKRLALARDLLGRGPLHLAVLNNHTTVARHLASAYPQSLKLLDRNGRSALHYAATLPDSGTMYKYLVNLGADCNVKDMDDNTPGIYLRNRDLLTHKELIEAAGPANVTLEPPVQRWERPNTPSVSTLATLESFYNSTLMQRESLWTKAWRRLTHQTESSFKALVRRYLDKDTFDLIKIRGMSDGSSLLDVIKFYPQFFIIAPGEEAYDIYQELFVPAILDHNHVEENFKGKTSILGETLPDLKIPQVDIPSKFVTQVRIRVSRNVIPFPFVPQMKKEDLIKVANLLKTVPLNWPCFDLESLEKEVLEDLKQKYWMPEATKISRVWPKQRYFVVSSDGNVQVWMNAEDHLDIVVTSKYGKLYPMFQTLNDVYTEFSQKFNFYENIQFGILTVDPFRVGTAMKITFRIRLPTLMRDPDELGKLCSCHNLSIRWKQNRIKKAEIEPDDWIELENNTTLGKSELNLAIDISKSINFLIKAEEEKARILFLAEKEINKK